MGKFTYNTMVDVGENDKIIISLFLWCWRWISDVFFEPQERIYFFSPVFQNSAFFIKLTELKC